jgi:putative heme-binding domain-containing protein
MNDPRPEIRIMAVRGLSRFVPHSEETIAKAIQDSDPGVRRQVLLEMAFPYRATTPQLASHGNSETYNEWLATLQRDYDGNDRFFREALGIAAEGRDDAAKRLLAEHEKAPWDKRVAGLALQYHTLQVFAPAMKAVEDKSLDFEVRESALRAIAAIGGDDAGAYLVARAKDSRDDEVQALAFKLLARNQGETWRGAMNANDLDSFIANEISEGKSSAGTLAFIRELRRDGLLPALVTNASASDLPDAERIDVLQTIGTLISRGKLEEFETWVKTLEPILASSNEEIHSHTYRAIAQTRGGYTREVLGNYVANTERPRSNRLSAIRTLSNTKFGARKLLDLAKADDIPDDILFNVSDTLRTVKFDDLRAEANKLMPPEESKDGEALPPLRELLRIQGNAERGKVLFFDEETASCSRCHSITNDGPVIGPNLGKIGEKLSRQAIFESILNPNAGISHEYQPWIIDTKKEEGLMGYIQSENAQQLDLVDSAGMLTSIPISDIVLREKSTISVMPTGLTSGMSVQELADLVSFVNSLE